MEAVRHADAREAVLRAPDDQRGHVQRRQLALVWLELLEVARSIELEMRAAALRTLEPLRVLVERVVAERGQRRGERVAGQALHQLLPLPRRSHDVREVVPL